MIGPRGGDHTVVGGVRAGHDGLGAQRFQRPLVTGLGPQHAHDVVLQRQLVDERQAAGIGQKLEGAVVLATVEADRTGAAEAEPRGAHSVELDATAARRGPHHGGPAGHREGAEIGDLDVRAASTTATRRVAGAAADAATLRTWSTVSTTAARGPLTAARSARTRGSGRC